MQNELDKVHAQRANLAAFDQHGLEQYADGAPHLLHQDISHYLNVVMARALEVIPKPDPSVLDLGAGEGAVTKLWLQRDARVTAVDLSGPMLAELEAGCQSSADRLHCVVSDVNEYLGSTDQKFDVISCISFLHHVPDYLSLIEAGARLLNNPGVLVTLGDPLRYDSLRFSERAFQQVSYAVWRITRPDVWGGINRRIRRMRGIYLEDSIYDNAEYHVTRNGVDQDAIARLLKTAGLKVEVHRYWSTQSRLGQRLGRRFLLNSDFSIFAVRS